MGGMLAIAGPALSAGSSLMSMFGGGNDRAQNVQLPQMWQMPNMTEAANNAFTGIGNQGQYNTAAQVLPAYQNLIGTYYQGNPFMGSGIQNMQNVSGAGQSVGQGMIDRGNALSGAGSSFLPYMGSIMNTAFDPQNALYGRTQQQLQEQTRAGLEARGLNSSPYGAGVENKAMSDFNIDWQNNQLQRQAGGAQAASGILGAGGQAIGQGQGLAGQGVGLMQNTALLPYQTWTQFGSDNMGALDRLSNIGTQASQIPQQQIQNYLNYIGAGNQAGSVANQTGQLGLNQAQLGFNQNQVLGANLGSSLAGLGKGLNSMFAGGSPNIGYGSGSNGWLGNTGFSGWIQA